MEGCGGGFYSERRVVTVWGIYSEHCVVAVGRVGGFHSERRVVAVGRVAEFYSERRVVTAGGFTPNVVLWQLGGGGS